MYAGGSGELLLLPVMPQELEALDKMESDLKQLRDEEE